MNEPQVAPYGTWKSPITTRFIAQGAVGLSGVLTDGDDIYWAESRPDEDGRITVMRRVPGGSNEEMVPAPFYVRSRVHEYGGAAFTMHEGALYFSNWRDQLVYRLEPGGEPVAITPDGYLYADLEFDEPRHRLIAVREDHTGDGEPVNSIVALGTSANPGGGDVLISGNDFYSNPRLSPDGLRLAWLEWTHPNMPWDGTELWTARVNDDGTLGQAEKVAGGTGESIFQPEWSPGGALYFVSDLSGWWNLYRLRNGTVEPLHTMEAEFGRPQWVFGLSTYAFAGDQRIYCTFYRRGIGELAVINTATGEMTAVPNPFSEFGSIRVAGGSLAMIASSSVEPAAVIKMDLTSGHFETLRLSSEVPVGPGYLSKPVAIEFPTEDGLATHGFFYPPKNVDFAAPAGEKPPLIVVSHGGPTGAASASFDLKKQFWTSRGFAVLDVNYGGSTGFGTEYRRRLNGRWGVLDVDDCANGAKYIVERGSVDGGRLLIRGSSAGGFTTLNALTFRNVFRAGASYYGIGDLEALARDNHKFESHYLDSMVGPYPEALELFRARSAIHHIDRLSTPVIFFQGLDDRVVSPVQSEMMVRALVEKGLPTAYLAFEGEQHGFRKAETIMRALDAELYFYCKVLGMEPPEGIAPVDITNM